MSLHSSGFSWSLSLVFALSGLTSLGACDAIIGIEELETPPTSNGLTCTVPSDCPGTGNPCVVRACTSDGKCELREVQSGSLVDPQTPGDCATVVCQGSAPISNFDAADVLDDGNLCSLETCVDGVGPMSGPAPEGTACGAMVCDGGGNCVECNTPADCGAGNQLCLEQQCVAMSCMDGVLSGNETDTDCGGDCLPCGVGDDCQEPTDCTSLVCEGSNGNETCQAPSCDDGVQNGSETDEDCGGSCQQGCGVGETCVDASDCAAQLNYCHCEAATCTCEIPTCFDLVMNGQEVDVDCGGPDCSGQALCQDGMPCEDHPDCISLVCENQLCAAPTCSDGVANGLEDGVDCNCPAGVCPECEPAVCGG